MGLYILFNIISPLIGKNLKFDVNEIMQNNQTQEASSETVNQESMDKRLKQIGEEELEKDIIEKVETEGYLVNYCKVELEIGSDSKIKNITLQIQKNEEQKKENAGKVYDKKQHRERNVDAANAENEIINDKTVEVEVQER